MGHILPPRLKRMKTCNGFFVVSNYTGSGIIRNGDRTDLNKIPVFYFTNLLTHFFPSLSKAVIKYTPFVS